MSAPSFQCMLAASEIPAIETIEFPVYASIKFDGLRCPTVDEWARSRKMEIFPNLFLQQWFQKNQSYLQGLDGELIVGPPNRENTFHTTQSAISSEDGEPDFRFYVFEHAQHSGDSQKRYGFLTNLIPTLPEHVRSRIVLVEQRLIHNAAELNAYYEQVTGLGYEGLILKHPRRHYKQGRSTLKEAILLKWKNFDFSEILIDGLAQGKTNKNEKTKNKLGNAKRSSAKAGKELVETIGTFLGKDVNPASPFFGMSLRVTGGVFKKDELARLWKEHCAWEAVGRVGKSPVLGRYMRYKYQTSGVKDKPRYPGAQGFRDAADMGEMSEAAK